MLLAKSDTRTVKFVDRTFNANNKRACEIFRFIIENYGTQIPKGICFHFEIAGDILSEEAMELLSTAPCGSIQLEIGLQSLNIKTLDSINRKTNLDKLTANINRLLSYGNIHIHIDLIVGLPYEDITSFSDSFNKAYELKPHMLQMGFLKLLHGSDLRKKAEQYKCRYTAEAPYEVMDTPWLSGEDIALLKSTEDALNRMYNSGRFHNTLEYIFTMTARTPFDVFNSFGRFTANTGTAKIKLDVYTKLVYDYFSSIDGVNSEVLREKKLSTDLQRILPERYPNF